MARTTVTSILTDPEHRVLTLPYPDQAPGRVLDTGWRALRDRIDGPEHWHEERDGEGWEAVTVPFLTRATPGEPVLWLRKRFSSNGETAQAGGRRTIVKFGGAFYECTVWLNETLLGTHRGYFEPFGFDVTDRLRADNLLVVRCLMPIAAGDFRNKRAVTGIFSDWDCKPYPSAAYPSLPLPFEWSEPVGLWRPVSLHPVAPVVVETLTVFSGGELSEGAAARPRAVARLRNLTAKPVEVTAEVTAQPVGFDGACASDRLSATLAPFESKLFELSPEIQSARLWWPWTHGDAALYEAKLSVGTPAAHGGSHSDSVTQRFGLRQVEARRGDGTWEWRLNGRRIFTRGSNYIADLAPDQVTYDGLLDDVRLARSANLDLLRVHAHIAPPELYSLCDELGVMVMCDFPLQWTYAHDLPDSEKASFQAEAVAQAEAMVRLLGSSPSIILWSAHNEPPWTESGSFLGANVHEARTNARLDQALLERVVAIDTTRPAQAASGEDDAHLYHGWYTGSWTDNRALSPAFPTEFGVQALPALESPFWGLVNTDWPVRPDDPTWIYTGYQALFWASPGIGPPQAARSLADYIASSQSYQSFYIQTVIDHWRRRKFDPVGGYVHFILTDGAPVISWSVVDYFRVAKEGLNALREASAPVAVCLELEEGYTVEGAHGLVYEPGDSLRAQLYVVNDDYRAKGRASLQWWIEPIGGGIRGGLRRVLARATRRRYALVLPPADGPALHATTVAATLGRPGRFVLRVRLTGSIRANQRRLDFRVGPVAEPEAHPRRAPGFLVRRVYERGSLRHTVEGYTFRLNNPAMPVTIERVVALVADGEPADPALITLVAGGSARRASSIDPHAPLEVPSGAQVAVLVGGVRLAPGQHDIELTAEFSSLGRVTARISDRLH